MHVYKWPLSLPPPKCTAKAKGRHPLPVLVRRLADGHFRASFTPKAAGSYALSVSVGGHAVHGAPFPLVVHADPTFAARSTLVVDALAGAAAGAEAAACVHTRAASGTPRRSAPDMVRAEVGAPDGRVLACEARPRDGGRTDLAFVPRLAGEHELRASVNGVPLAPARFVVAPGAPSA